MATEISNTTPDRAGGEVGRIDIGQHAALDRGGGVVVELPRHALQVGLLEQHADRRDVVAAERQDLRDRRPRN